MYAYLSVLQRPFLLALGFVCLALVVGLAGRAQASGAVDITAEPSFSGMQPGSIYPVAVTLKNTGASLNGILQVRADSYMTSTRIYDYPISLPTGAIKSLIVYPTTQIESQDIDLVYLAGRESVEFKMPVGFRGSGGAQIGLVGDEIGGLAGITPTAGSPWSGPNPYSGSSSSTSVLSDCYTSPEAAPDRSSGYRGLHLLYITNGAERLSPSQWQAIEEWTLSGGSLVLSGGAGATYLRSPWAKNLVPVTDAEGYTVSGLQLPAALGGAHAGPISLTTGPLKPGATVLAEQDGHVVLAEERYGAGSVLFLAFNPLDQPLRSNRTLLSQLINGARAGTTPIELSVFLNGAGPDQPEGYYSSAYPTTTPAAPYGYTPDAGHDPFQVHLPPIITIAWIFLAYFLLAVPVTFLVLRKLGRMNLAWVVGPVLSIGCAFVFYLFTVDLYQAGLSRRTDGIVVMRSGSPGGIFDGDTELFIPRGGAYDIRVPDALSLETTPIESGNDTYSPDREQALETVDNGTVQAPGYSVGNLAFRRFYYTQPVSAGGAITAHLQRSARGALSGTVQNGTDWTLAQARLLLPDQLGTVSLGDMKPGETKTVDLMPEVVARLNSRGYPVPLRGRVYDPVDELDLTIYRRLAGAGGLSTNSGAYLVAHVSGAPFGPTLGRYVGGNDAIGLFTSVSIESDAWREPERTAKAK